MSAKERALTEIARRKDAKAPEITGSADKTVTEGGKSADFWASIEKYRENPTTERKQGLDLGEGIIGAVREGADAALLGLGNHMEAGARATMALPQALSKRHDKALEDYGKRLGKAPSWNPLEGVVDEFSMGYGDAREQIEEDRNIFQTEEPEIAAAAPYAAALTGGLGLAKTLGKKALTSASKDKASSLASRTPKPKPSGRPPVRNPKTGRMEKAPEPAAKAPKTGILGKVAKGAAGATVGGAVAGPAGAALGAAVATPIGRKVLRKAVSKLTGSHRLGSLSEQLAHPVNKRGLNKAKNKLKEWWKE